ncbi:uncharacterized protein LOC111921071 [Lactuca sativa]|uniref:uncharacterized protein LOC111921071 n=1 Tax=Lactuca sativa TaxID=4236 RepID=UPI000CD9F4B2|nr:uncharacterized protein LOC111921071 [Lactuca sativa]
MEKASTIVLNELCSTSVISGLLIKIGDPSQLTFPCEFGNSTSINALANSGESINLMPYSFYKKLGLPRLQDMKMTLRMADHTITNPRRIIEDLLVKLGNFVFLVDFVVLYMKENEYLPIILARPFLSTARSLVDIHESKLTLCIEDEELTFKMRCGELEEPTMVKMELDEKKSNKVKGKNKRVKCKHEGYATQKKKENPKKKA